MADNGKRVITIFGSREATIIRSDQNGKGAKWYTIEFDDGTRKWVHEDTVKIIPNRIP